MSEPKSLMLSGVGGPCKFSAEKAANGQPSKMATFTMLAYTGDSMRLGGWGPPVVVDLDGVEQPSVNRPIFRQHDPLRIVGHSTAVRIDADGIHIDGAISGVGDDAKEIVSLAGNGFPWQASIGAEALTREFVEPGVTVTVNGREFTGPLEIARQTRLGEISFVPLGADDSTSATVSASKRGEKKMNLKAALKLIAGAKYSAEDIDAMNEDEAKAALKKCMDDEPDGDEKKAKKSKAEGDEEDVEAADDEPDGDEKDKKAHGRFNLKAQIANGRKTLAAEHRRVNEIMARCQAYTGIDKCKLSDGTIVDLIPHAIEHGWSADKTELAAGLHSLRAGRPGVVPGGLGYGVTRPDVNDAVLEAAVMQAAGSSFRLWDDSFYHDQDAGRTVRRVPEYMQRKTQTEMKARYTDQVQQAAHSLYKGRIGLQQLLTTSAAQHGYRGSEVIRDDGDIEATLKAQNWIRADGASTASIANVLANVLNKFLLQGYLFVEQAWREFTGIRPVKDFKPTKSVNLFGDFIYESVGPSGELAHGSLQDQAFANQATTSGKILNISRTHIINDDLGALTTVPMLMGRGAGLKLNNTFWTLWNNPGYDEGGTTAFWAATHTLNPGQTGNSNYISGGSSALSSTSLQTAKQTYDKQVDPKGYPLGVEAEVLLYPPELDQTAWELLNSSMIVYGGSTATKQPANNRWVNKYRPVMSRYLSNSSFTGYSTTAWWMLANPSILPAIEACFLNGQEVPTVQQAGPDYQFNILGISVRGFFDFGVGMQNFRAGVKSAGA